MKVNIQLKTIYGNLIFELEKENNSISEVVKEYIKDELSRGKSSADLSSANLRYANLRYANLSYADLSSADLSSADLRSANLSYADLRSANLSEDTGFLLSQCPTEGSFIAWKKASDKIIKLEICADSLRSSATTLKCRCSSAKCLEIQELDGTKCNLKEIPSSYDSSFIYKVGKISKVDNFDEDRFNECSTGIHFFISREMAVQYN